jgi:(p)ppGpp synthase/HD superfamily hydrolase
MARTTHETAAAILEAALFAAEKHRNCRRKGPDATPYINHPITVANLLARAGEVDDVEVLQAALLHDTVEDTEATSEEIEEHFGRSVRDLVDEVTDDKDLEKAERKQRQVEKAPKLSPGAKMIKIADKIANVTDIMEAPPADWSVERRVQYIEWSAKVVDGCRGQNENLERAYDSVASRAIKLLRLGDQ